MCRGGLCLFFSLLLVSCTYLKSEEELTQERVWAALNDQSWDSVDAFPLFDTCPERESARLMRDCFENTLNEYLYTALDALSYEIEGDMDEEVSVVFTIDKDGFINLDTIETNETVDRLIPNLKDDLQASFSRLFSSRNAITVSPAHKQGISVSMKVRLPIILRT